MAKEIMVIISLLLTNADADAEVDDEAGTDSDVDAYNDADFLAEIYADADVKNFAAR